ncbi:hypothetical protein MSSIT_1055 [Methanosarcina siciliae T4/M]|uniref:Uncharacterized protein n=2 Tax=Methanosarcina siciliae TaxID=38027 RepID=A0A0E3PC07_9EURY|nr:hypothetical protein MSSIT_1055 [Methanosarcina siciliae T4/M]AKB31698.1 hypothetical protein MSSIH_1008 [Methanosarcina siciliae HI350]
MAATIFSSFIFLVFWVVILISLFTVLLRIQLFPENGIQSVKFFIRCERPFSSFFSYKIGNPSLGTQTGTNLFM